MRKVENSIRIKLVVSYTCQTNNNLCFVLDQTNDALRDIILFTVSCLGNTPPVIRPL
jgi:hypothetical protein